MVIEMFDKNLIGKIEKGFLVFILFWYSALLQYIPIVLFKLDVSTLSQSMQVILSAFSSTIVLFLLVFLYRKDLTEDFKKFKNHLMTNIDTGFKCWFIGLLAMMVSNIIISMVFKTGGANNENQVQNMISALPWLMVINAGIIAPFNEEIVFRKTLKDVFKNKWIFVLLSFLLFGGAHVINSAKTLVDYLYIIPYGALGASFAFAYYKTDTVFTSISFHMIHNLTLVLISIFL